MASQTPTRVFFDDTALATAIASDGAATILLRQGFLGRLVPVVSHAVLEAASRRLADGSPTTGQAFDRLVAACEMVLSAPPPWVERLVGQVFSKEAALVLASAAHAQTPYLVTHDEQLLDRSQDIKSTFNITVTTPEGLLPHVLEETQGDKPRRRGRKPLLHR